MLGSALSTVVPSAISGRRKGCGTGKSGFSRRTHPPACPVVCLLWCGRGCTARPCPLPATC